MNKKSMNWEDALKLALLLSLFWTLIFLLGHTGAGWLPQKVENAKEDGLFLHLVRQFVTSTVSFFILFCFQFSIFNRKWKFNKKLGVSIAGSLSITFLFFLAVGTVFYLFDMQPPGEKASQIIDRLVQINGIELNQMSFSVKNNTEHFAKSRELAFRKAEEKAKQYAELSGLKVAHVLSISEETNQNNLPIYRQKMLQNNIQEMSVAEDVVDSTVLPSGELEITTKIVAEFILE